MGRKRETGTRPLSNGWSQFQRLRRLLVAPITTGGPRQPHMGSGSLHTNAAPAIDLSAQALELVAQRAAEIVLTRLSQKRARTERDLVAEVDRFLAASGVASVV